MSKNAPPNGPSTTGNKSGDGRGNNPPKGGASSGNGPKSR